VALILRKYYKLFFFLVFCSFFCGSCGFPYNTPQARAARKIQRLAKLEARKKAKEAPPTPSSDSAVVQTAIKKDGQQDTAPNITTKDTSNLAIAPLDTAAVDTLAPIAVVPTIDSLEALAIADSLYQDSLEQVALMQEAIDRQIRYSQDSVSTPVQYASADSMIYDLAQRKVYLYHNAEVFYEQYSLTAGYIEFNFLTNVATATCLLDSAGKEVECPFFDDKSQQFTSRRIEFNFKTKKGKVYDASTQQGDGFLVSNATKFISKGADSTGNNTQDILYSQGCLYTTCDAKHPHFGIRASKAKIIPGKLIVVGPSFLEIMGSPTPLILPFGFFPITKNKRSGLVLSMDIDYASPIIGPGIREIGFYYGESEYWDLKVTGDFYMRGSLRARAISNYNIRYKSNGTINIGYTRLQEDNVGAPDYKLTQSFNFRWTHSQAAQAHPSQTFTATVDFGTSDFYQNTFNDAANVLKQTFTSTIGYTKRFTGTPFTLTTSLTHRQDASTRIMSITLPTLTFSMNQIFPFKRKVVTGKQRWYERIGFSYNVTGSNTITTTDTALFQPGGLQDALENAEYSLTHSPNLAYSFKLFDAINVEPNVRYSQRWFFYRNIQTFDTTTVIDPETEVVQYGNIENSREYGFFTTHDFSAGINVNTQIFATGRFNIGSLKEMRAVISPRVGFQWSPDYTNAADYYYDSVRYDNRFLDQRRYNYFSYAPPSGRTANLNYNLNTRLEAKLKKGVRDSLVKEPYKKVVLIPSLNITGNYNMAADSNHFSVITLNTYTTVFKKLQLRFTSVFDPYQADVETNQRLAAFEFERSGQLLRTTSMQFSASTSFNSKDLVRLFAKKGVPQDSKKKEFDLLQTISINYNLVVNRRFINGIDSSQVGAHQINFSGGVNLSKGWSFSINRIGYSFKDQRITFPDFTFKRELHCWEMGMSWQPERQTWSFFLRAKPGSLGFLEVPVKQEFYDTF
jgi:lipopolysaccharide export system protein LptA